MTTKIEIFASCRPNGLTRFFISLLPPEQDLHLFEACIESFSIHIVPIGGAGGFFIWDLLSGPLWEF
jgi:hypothetical protein